MNPLTVNQVITAAIAAERAAEALYRRLQEACAEKAPEMAGFWKRMADDEAGHASWITGLRSRLDRDTLDLPVDDEITHMVLAAGHFSVDQAWEGVSNLEDAYRLAERLEYAETNAIFHFLVQHIETNPKMQVFLDDQLEQHVEGLGRWLPAEYRDEAARRTVRLR
jgi:hypothetical protein